MGNVKTAAELLAGIPPNLVEYPLWTPGTDPTPKPAPRSTPERWAPCGTTSARRRHRRRRENCPTCDAAFHGTRSCYINRGCRCEPCVQANTTYLRTRRAGAA